MNACSLSKTRWLGLSPERQGVIHTIPIPKSLHWLKFPERIHALKSSVTHLQFAAKIIPAHLPSRTFHHNPANPLYPILLLSHLLSISQSLLVLSSPTEPYPSLLHV